VINFVRTDKGRYNVNVDNQAKDGDDHPMEEADDVNVQDQLLKDDHETLFTENQIAKFKEFSKDPLMYEKLVDAFAPSIWENNDVKKGIMCQLFGGCSKEFS